MEYLLQQRWKLLFGLFGLLCLIALFLGNASLITAVFVLLLVGLPSAILIHALLVHAVVRRRLVMFVLSVVLAAFSLALLVGAERTGSGMTVLGDLVGLLAFGLFAEAVGVHWVGKIRNRIRPPVPAGTVSRSYDDTDETISIDTGSYSYVLSREEFTDLELTGQVTRVPVDAVWVYVLIAINIVIFLVSTASPDILTWGANNRLAVVNSGEFYRMVTAMFLHIDLGHIVFNMLVLYQVGRIVEGYYGHARFVAIYLLGGLSGSLASIVLNEPLVTSVGASGAVFALVGAELALDIKGGGLGEFGKAGRGWVVLIGLNLIYGLSNPGIDNWAHLGGLAGGALTGWVALPLFQQVRSSMYGAGYAIFEAHPRASRNLVAMALLLIGLLSATAIGSGSPRIFNLDGLTVTMPAGWRTATTFEGEEFCAQGGVKCLLVGVSPTGSTFEIDRFSGFFIAISSLDAFDSAAVDEIESQGGKLVSRDAIQIDHRDAIKHVYDFEGKRRLIVLSRDRGGIVRFFAGSPPASFVRDFTIFETILESIRFDSE